MATIFFSMAGEGRGHAARARALVEAMKHEHRFVLFAPHQAYEFLAPCYVDDPQVDVEEVPGIIFHYSRNRLDLSRSFYEGVRYRLQLGKLVARIIQRIDQESPAVAIADFEPALPRAARMRGVPVISIDHQHFLLAYDLSILPRGLQRWAGLMGQVVRFYGIRPDKTVVSAFFKPPLKKAYQHVVQVGPLLRPEVLGAETHEGEHLLTYLRGRSSLDRVLDALRSADREVRVYGLGKRGDDGPLRFCEIDNLAFVEDLASCSAVVSAAGNQLLGESLQLGKPFFAMPEKKHHEQLINANFLRQMGAGDFVTLEQLSEESLHGFLNHLDDFRIGAEQYRGKIDGTSATVEVIREAVAESEAGRAASASAASEKLV